MPYTPDQLHTAIETNLASRNGEMGPLVRLARRLVYLRPAGPNAEASRRMAARFETTMAGRRGGLAALLPLDWRRNPGLARRFAGGALAVSLLTGAGTAAGVSPIEAVQGTAVFLRDAVLSFGPGPVGGPVSFRPAEVDVPEQQIASTDWPLTQAADAPGASGTPGPPNGAGSPATASPSTTSMPAVTPAPAISTGAPPATPTPSSAPDTTAPPAATGQPSATPPGGGGQAPGPTGSSTSPAPGPLAPPSNPPAAPPATPVGTPAPATPSPSPAAGGHEEEDEPPTGGEEEEPHEDEHEDDRAEPPQDEEEQR